MGFSFFLRVLTTRNSDLNCDMRLWACEGNPSGMILSPVNQPKNYNMKIPTLAIVAIVPFLGFVSSCKEKGPAEKAGESLDKAVENVKDAVDPKTPLEKAGEKVDDALGK